VREEEECAPKKEKKQLVVGYRNGAREMALLYLLLLVPSVLTLKLLTLPLNHSSNNNPLRNLSDH